MFVLNDDVRTRLDNAGYYYGHDLVAENPTQHLLAIARSIGDLFVPLDCDTDAPVIRTAPARSKRAAPFDRPEAIGWHGDFATYEDRPEYSLVYITRPDPRGGNFGAWRLASVARLVAHLRTTIKGSATLDLLGSEFLPFSYAEGEPSRWFRIFESRPEWKLGLRFYLPSLRRGCIAEYGEVPSRFADAFTSLEAAADEVGEIMPTHAGSLLITSNWHALHDRVQQTVSRTRLNREALLCFVSRTH